ncbi:MAG: RsmB/NOP family class I SAM-dependent RNA methyltransferase [Alphaproteobacteria bacterium]|nr:RsmB/NOP family class I SAM-dependent RNA methyltransferase [Alphaproteobacteria bacterium]
MQLQQIKIAAREVLEQILNTTQPASEVVNAYTRARRYIGSKDRRALTDMVWGVLRAYRRLVYDLPNGTLDDKIEAVLTGKYTSDYRPAGASDAICFEVPDWMINHVENPAQELPALLQTPDTILRANGNREKIAKLLLNEGIETEPTKMSPYGLVLKKRVNLNACQAYKNGLVEVQDEGSQLVALETGIKAGDTVLDYCAGAGGKSLIFAQMMNGQGQIVAHDVSVRSLNELEKRAKRASIKIIRTQTPIGTTDYPDGFDHVVVDAPCSGTGTWRRCPDARLKLTEMQVQDICQKQADILDKACRFVRVGGYLSYMTCSVLKPENRGRVDAFLSRHNDFEFVREKQCSPFRTGTDGLYVAVLKRK